MRKNPKAKKILLGNPFHEEISENISNEAKHAAIQKN